MSSFSLFSQKNIDQLKYTFTLDDNKERIDVAITYQARILEDTVRLRIPSSYDRSKMTNTITIDNLRLTSEGDLIQAEFDKCKIISKQKIITLNYSIGTFSNDTTQLSCDGDDFFMPVINTKFFHMFGDKSMILPDFNVSEERRFNIELEWINFPKNWHIASDYGISNPDLKHRKKFYKEDVLQEDIGNSLFIGGKYEKTSFRVDDINFHIYLYGAWKFENEVLIDMIKKVAEAEMKVWNHFQHTKDYVISITQKGTNDCGRITGRNMFDSFCYYLPGKFTNDHLEFFRHHLTHEFTHTWIGANLAANNPKPGTVKWFTEGFTDYYANRVSLIAGYINNDQYISKLNEFIQIYKLSPYRSLNIHQFDKNYLFDERLENLAYQKGAVFAFYFDGYIREKTENKANLDDLMMVLLSDTYVTTMNQNITIDFINDVAKKSLELDVSELFERYITNGEIIPIYSPLIETMDTIEKTSFDYGFDYLTSIEEEVIHSVVNNSNAYNAGLRNGQKFLGITRMTSNPNEKMILNVSDEKGMHTVEFYPKGEVISVPVITKLKLTN